MTRVCPSRNDLLFTTSNSTINAPRKADSSFHYQDTLVREQSANPELKLSKDSCLWKSLTNLQGRFEEFDAVMQDAEVVPAADFEKPPTLTFYLPMHAVYKASSSTTKVRAVFDASAKSSTSVSLNDILLVGPTVHPTLIDVLLRFQMHPVALTADVSKMYWAVELVDDDKDFHRFVWRNNPNDSLVDYRMTRVTFGVSSSSFAANMAVKQNVIGYSLEYPEAAEVVHKSRYVDDCLTGAEDPESALTLQQQLTELFSRGGLILRK